MPGLTKYTTSMFRRERDIVIRIAQAHLAGDALAIESALFDAVLLIPTRACDACGVVYLMHDARKARFCSSRCRYRIGQRDRRARAKACA